MALFIDGPSSSIQNLTDQDSGLLEVCRTEQINATTKLSLAHDEMSADLDSLFAGQRSIYGPVYGQPRLNKSHVAVTPPLVLWHTFQTLSLIYRDAYFNQLNDRYQAKWEQFQKLSNNAYKKFREIGAGLVLNPLPRPESPLLSTVPATETGGTFYFAITYLNSTGEESASSFAESFAVPDGAAVDIQLVPPPVNVSGWNVYVGTAPDSLYLQNEDALTPDSDSLFYPSTLVTAGDTPGAGQKPNYFRSLPRLIQRG